MMKSLALALATTTAIVPNIPSANATYAGAKVLMPIHGARFDMRGNASRPDRIPGEYFVYRHGNISSGSLTVGDFAAITKKSSGSSMESFMLGAALVLQAKQSYIDRDTQAFISENFETYWD